MSDKNKPKLRPAPAFQEYASDLLANRHYRLMTLAEKGLFHLLRNECWVNLSLPSDHAKLAKYLGESNESIDSCLTDSVLHFFKITGDQMRCPELDGYRDELAIRHQKISEGGSKGGKSTQTKYKKGLEATLDSTVEASLKPLSRAEVSGVELSRNEKSKDELLNKEVNSFALVISNKEWLKDYE